MEQFEDSMNAYRDITNAINTARRDSREEGKKEERIRTIKRMRKYGMNDETISEILGVDVSDIVG